MGIYSMTNHLCNELVDEDNANVTASQETPGNEGIINVNIQVKKLPDYYTIPKLLFSVKM